MTKLIDLSIPLEAGVPSDPPQHLPDITYRDHQEGAAELLEMFPGLKQSQLFDGEGPAIEQLRLTTHNGTHLDAPWHFHSTMDGGVPALKVDEIPLEWCFSDGVKLDFRHFSDGYVCTAEDVENELKRIGYTLKPLDIVLINTSAGAAYGSSAFVESGCGMGREATLYLTEHGVKIAGVDAWSWDAPFSYTLKRFQETGDASIIWEGHKASIERGYCHIEKLTNLDKLPDFGFKVSCFPVKVARASAGWVRAVAHVETD